ncbi:hypothetical protein ACFQOZ_02830 [Comamonas endophytica]|uniref:hypothetical protein n=1 Tax=Comamonas endophytica TaxID=2949090 RepID=UPI003612E29F
MSKVESFGFRKSSMAVAVTCTLLGYSSIALAGNSSSRPARKQQDVGAPANPQAAASARPLNAPFGPAGPLDGHSASAAAASGVDMPTAAASAAAASAAVQKPAIRTNVGASWSLLDRLMLPPSQISQRHRPEQDSGNDGWESDADAEQYAKQNRAEIQKMFQAEKELELKARENTQKNEQKRALRAAAKHNRSLQVSDDEEKRAGTQGTRNYTEKGGEKGTGSGERRWSKLAGLIACDPAEQ